MFLAAKNLKEIRKYCNLILGKEMGTILNSAERERERERERDDNDPSVCRF